MGAGWSPSGLKLLGVELWCSYACALLRDRYSCTEGYWSLSTWTVSWVFEDDARNPRADKARKLRGDILGGGGGVRLS